MGELTWVAIVCLRCENFRSRAESFIIRTIKWYRFSLCMRVEIVDFLEVPAFIIATNRVISRCPMEA